MDATLPLILKFITDVLNLVPASPFMYLIVLAMVLVVFNHIYGWILGK